MSTSNACEKCGQVVYPHVCEPLEQPQPNVTVAVTQTPEREWTLWVCPVRGPADQTPGDLCENCEERTIEQAEYVSKASLLAEREQRKEAESKLERIEQGWKDSYAARGEKLRKAQAEKEAAESKLEVANARLDEVMGLFTGPDDAPRFGGGQRGSCPVGRANFHTIKAARSHLDTEA